MSTRRISARALGVLGMSAIGTALSLVVAVTPAQASTNIGWLYTQNAAGKAFFDADVAGWEGAEEIKACDVKTDGAAVIAILSDENDRIIETVRDTGNDGSCTSTASNMIADEKPVKLKVCIDDGTSVLKSCASAWGRS
ncbi:hypothetical protein [Micromonospora sp. KC213]|uniref:hypothetical protein n=1 Tax=Micromonospora sp. KC213 TaxID=2530378 RepID=UPI00104C5CDE|nr:hypothetical protein [Micromonospora sp. KC213]TDC35222.1 hypothetical protein E1166_23820 [Micromonospora sp. KC213]